MKIERNKYGLSLIRACLLQALILLLFSPVVAQQQYYFDEEEQVPVHVFLSPVFKLADYESFSQTKTTFPFKAGYPSYVSRHLALDLHLKVYGRRVNHFFEVAGMVPAPVASDNGLKQDLLLKPEGNFYARYHASYTLQGRLLQLGGSTVYHGFSAAGLYEWRELNFLSGKVEKQSDIGFGIGPAFSITIPLGENVLVKGEGRFLFYLPWLGTGRWEATNSTEQELSSLYSPFTYASTVGLNMVWPAKENFQLIIGFRRNGQVGFSGASPTLKPKELVTYKLDRINEFHFGFIIKTGRQ